MSKVTLFEACDFTMGQSPSSESYNNEGRGIPFYQGNADFGRRTPVTRVWCDAPKKKANPGDILLSVRAPIGAINVAIEECCIGRGLAALAPKKGKTDPEYLQHFLRYIRPDLERLGTGSTFKAIGKNVLSKVKIPLPESGKQISIAESLNGILTQQDYANESFETLDELVKSRFVEMFGNQENEWETVPLGDMCTVVRGGSPRPISNYLGGDIPWIKIGDASKNDSIYLHSTKEFITRDGIKKSRLLKPGSLIFANSGVSLGFARIITFEGCVHDGWLALQDVDERLDKVFLLLSLNQMTDEFRTNAPSGTQPNLNTDIMKRHSQIVPPMEAQKEFVSFVQQVDKLKFAVQQQIDKLQLLYDSLAQEYFGGE